MDIGGYRWVCLSVRHVKNMGSEPEMIHTFICLVVIVFDKVSEYTLTPLFSSHIMTKEVICNRV